MTDDRTPPPVVIAATNPFEVKDGVILWRDMPEDMMNAAIAAIDATVDDPDIPHVVVMLLDDGRPIDVIGPFKSALAALNAGAELSEEVERCDKMLGDGTMGPTPFQIFPLIAGDTDEPR